MKDWVNFRFISLELKRILKERVFFIISALFIGIGISSVVTFFILPLKYSSSVQMIASVPQNENSNMDINGLNFNIQMINTYKDILLKSNNVAEATAKKLKRTTKFSRSSESIKGMIQMDQTENSQVFSIIVTSDNPYEAKEIANIVASQFEKQVESVVSMDKVSILEEAKVDETIVSPNYKLNLILGAFLGLFTGVSLSLLFELLNRKVTSQRVVTEIFDVPIIGVVNELSFAQLNLEVDFDEKRKEAEKTELKKGKTVNRRRKRKKI